MPASPAPRVDLTAALPPWVYMYRRLVSDGNRGVRAEAAAVLGALAAAVGKAIAPQLRGLMGPWWVAQFDPYSDAAAAARSAFQVCHLSLLSERGSVGFVGQCG